MEVGVLYVLLSVYLLFIVLMSVLCTCYENYESIDYTPSSKYIEPENIHIYMTYDKDYEKEITQKTSVINKKYAEKYGFNFHKILLQLDQNKNINYELDNKSYKAVPHYGRYIELYNIMDHYPEDSIFIYVDSDAAFIEQDFDVRDWIPENVDILFGNEMNYNIPEKIVSTIRCLMYGFSFNSGFMIIKNTPWTKEFLKRVLTSTTCKDTRLVKSMFYDQSCISEIYKNNKNDEHNHIKVIPENNRIQYCVFDKKTPILHTAGSNKKDLFKYVQI